MNKIFESALKFTYHWEGGYSNRANDPGGATMFGVTQGVYNKYLQDKGLPIKPVSKITREESTDLYYKYYWLPAQCDKMCDALAIVMFDTAVNFGVSGAVMFLQETLGNLIVDGEFGPNTEAELEDKNNYTTAKQMCEARIAYRYKRVHECPSQQENLQGWLNRDNALLEYIEKYHKPNVSELHARYSFQEYIINIARREKPTGYKNMEIWGANDGPKVRKYLRSVGINFPAPWCAAFVYWCISKLVEELQLNTMPFPRTGYCPTIELWAREHNILADTPEPGDVFLLYDYLGVAHTGFVTDVIVDDKLITIKTIEGNTNIGGSPEGIGIFERERVIRNKNLRFVKWYKLIKRKSYKIMMDNKVIIENAPIIDGRTIVPIREISEKLGANVYWNKEAQCVDVNGKRIIKILFLNGKTYCHIRQLSHILKILHVDNKTYIINIKKK